MQYKIEYWLAYFRYIFWPEFNASLGLAPHCKIGRAYYMLTEEIDDGGSER